MRQRKAKKCAEWLAYCLEIGWDKSQIDALEKLWMDNHDDNGNFKAQLQQGGVVRPEVEGAKEGELLGNAVGKGVCAGSKHAPFSIKGEDGILRCSECGERYHVQ